MSHVHACSVGTAQLVARMIAVLLFRPDPSNIVSTAALLTILCQHVACDHKLQKILASCDSAAPAGYATVLIVKRWAMVGPCEAQHAVMFQPTCSCKAADRKHMLMHHPRRVT